MNKPGEGGDVGGGNLASGSYVKGNALLTSEVRGQIGQTVGNHSAETVIPVNPITGTNLNLRPVFKNTH